MICEKLIIRDKFSIKLKKYKLHEDIETYKTAQYNEQYIIAENKIGIKHTERVDKTKDIWMALKALSLTKKSGGFIISALNLEHDTKLTLKVL